MVSDVYYMVDGRVVVSCDAVEGSLQDLKRRLESELSRRESLRTDRGHERASDVRTSFCSDEIVSAFRELIRLENASLHHRFVGALVRLHYSQSSRPTWRSQIIARVLSDGREVFEAAEAALCGNPDSLANSIVLHFGKLFDVKKLDGMFPKMNVGSCLLHHCSYLA